MDKSEIEFSAEQREKLIELLETIPHTQRLYPDLFVDRLIANGVRLEEKQATSDESKWIPVTERLPEKEMEVIVYTGNILKPSVFCYHFWTADLLSWQSVTHWMPLPEPPKGSAS